VLRDTGERHVFAASPTFAGSPAPHLLQHLDAPAPPQHRRKVAAVVAKGRRDEPGGIARLGKHLGERRIGNRLVADEAGKLTVIVPDRRNLGERLCVALLGGRLVCSRLAVLRGRRVRVSRRSQGGRVMVQRLKWTHGGDGASLIQTQPARRRHAARTRRASATAARACARVPPRREGSQSSGTDGWSAGARAATGTKRLYAATGHRLAKTPLGGSGNRHRSANDPPDCGLSPRSADRVLPFAPGCTRSERRTQSIQEHSVG
jgi:hypothetical protein